MNGSPNLQNHLATWRILVFVVVIGMVFVAFVGRLFSLQVLEGGSYTAQANDNRIKEMSLPAMRGIIYDRNGIVLAQNVASYNVVITAADLPDDAASVQRIFRELSRLIDMPLSHGELSKENPYVPCISDHGIQQIAEYADTSKPFEAVRVKCDIDRKTAMIIQEKSMDWPGISVEVQPIRSYPTGSITASVVGFLGPIPGELEADYKEKGLVPNRDKVGYAGLELEYQNLLAGKNGLRVSEVDVAGKVVRNNIEPPIDPQPGLSLRLTLDTRLQQATTGILEENIKDWNTFYENQGREPPLSYGVAIAINPKTGEVLAMVSYPSYENNRMARLIPAYYYDQLVKDPTNPLLNHAVGDVLPAGSVFKLTTAVGALNEGVVTPEEIIKTPGKLTITDRPFANAPGRDRDFVDWIYKTRPEGFGQLDFVHGLANSSNVYFYKLGGGYQDEVPNGGLGICRLGTYAKALGYGDKPGIGLPDEEKGLIPDPTWKRITHAESWTVGDTYIASVGQGYVLATPIQVLLSAATIANNGKLMQPTLIEEVQDGEGNVVPMYLDQDGNPTRDRSKAVRTLSPFEPHAKWDITKDPVIQKFNETTIKGCEPRDEWTTVQPWVLDKVREGMRLAVTEGTLAPRKTDGYDFTGFETMENTQGIRAAGKTGTAEYCDKYAAARNICQPGNWPSHAWTIAFAPFDNPEIAVVAFVYNGNEGASVAGPIVREVIQSYFELKAIDTASQPQQ